MRSENTELDCLKEGAHVNSQFRNALFGYISTGGNGKIKNVNEAFLSLSGFSRNDVVQKIRFEDLLPIAGRIFYQNHVSPMLKLGSSVSEIALHIVGKNRTRLPVLVNIEQQDDVAGNVVDTHYTIYYAGERWRYEQELLRARKVAEESQNQLLQLNSRLVESNAALHQQSERLNITLSAIADGVVATDNCGLITYINPAAIDFCSTSVDSAIGCPLIQVFRPINEQTGGTFDLLNESTKTLPEPVAAKKWRLHSGDRELALKIDTTSMRNEHGEQAGFLIVFRDISAAQQYETALHELATRDALTGLINRREFERRLTEVLQPDGPEGYTLMYLDLDQFKIVNDTCGHGAGDELMRQFAQIMPKSLRQDDTLARLGGDEFGVLLQRSNPDAAMAVAERLRKTVKDFDFIWVDKTFPIGVSIGVIDLKPGQMNLADAMRLADSACYVAKAKGRNRVHLTTCDDLEVEHHKGEVSWISRLHAALRDERFVLFGQRIKSLQPQLGRPEHIEILIRMKEVSGILVSPMGFIPAAERYGIMPQIDRWVFRTLLQNFHRLHPSGTQAPIYAVNLSGTTLCDEGFQSFVCQEFVRCQVPPSNICFEITETAAIANLEQATRFITALKQIGCQFSLDDFGSGMSSFGYLKRLPVDFLKIDGRFVKDLIDDRVNHAMVDAINRVGQVMGLSTIAEFVESDEILFALREIGVDFAQGYAIHKPELLF